MACTDHIYGMCRHVGTVEHIYDLWSIACSLYWDEACQYYRQNESRFLYLVECCVFTFLVLCLAVLPVVGVFIIYRI
jgi:hypothetical protein